MMINRRTFVAGAVVAAVAPTPDLLARLSAPPAEAKGRVVFLVEGWSVQSDDETADRMWLRIDRGWRTSWR
jgi:hypothetical protein